MELELFWETFGKTASPVELGYKIVGAAWSYVFVAPLPQWKPEGAPRAAPWLKLLHFRPFGRAPALATKPALELVLELEPEPWQTGRKLLREPG